MGCRHFSRQINYWNQWVNVRWIGDVESVFIRYSDRAKRRYSYPVWYLSPLTEELGQMGILFVVVDVSPGFAQTEFHFTDNADSKLQSDVTSQFREGAIESCLIVWVGWSCAAVGNCCCHVVTWRPMQIVWFR